MIDNLEFEDPTEEMNNRWQARIEAELPAIDVIDSKAEKKLVSPEKRQFAPEYTQSSYLTIIRQE